MSEQAQDIVERLRKLMPKHLNAWESKHDAVEIARLNTERAEAANEITRLRAELEEARETIRKVQGTLVAVHYEIDPEKYGNADIPRAWALTTVALSDIRAFLSRQEAEHGEPSVRQMIDWMRSRPETENWGRAAEYLRMAFQDGARLMSTITDKDIALLNEVLADPRAAEMLRGKCRWEHMTLHAALREWGDPRTWPDYMEEKHG